LHKFYGLFIGNILEFPSEVEVTKRLEPGSELYTNYDKKYPWNGKEIYPPDLHVTAAGGKKKKRAKVTEAPVNLLP